jgi:hypothetical protein
MSIRTKSIIVLAAVGVIALMCLISGFIILGMRQKIKEDANVEEDFPMFTATPETTIALDYVEPTEANTVYFCQLDSENVMYLRNGSDRTFELFHSEADPTRPYTEWEEGKADVSRLTECLEVYAGDTQEEIYIEGYKVKDYMVYVALAVDSTNTYSYPDTSLVLKKNISTPDYIVMFTKKIYAEESLFGVYDAALQIYDLVGMNLIIDETSCYGCGDASKHFVAVNLNSNEYVALDTDIGNITYDAATRMIKYNKLAAVGTLPGCDVGVVDDCNIYEPTGAAGEKLAP